MPEVSEQTVVADVAQRAPAPAPEPPAAASEAETTETAQQIHERLLQIHASLMASHF